ncbi:MAG: DUF84 family protein [Thermoanaerobaculia bacterium]
MKRDLREFWGRYPSGIEVCVAGTASDLLLGVRDAFRRYFHDGLDRPLPVAVVPQETEPTYSGFAASDEEAIERARGRARELEARLPGTYHFYLGSEACLPPLEVAGATRYFVRNWVAIAGLAGEACGASGSLQLPAQLISGLDAGELPFAAPGTRRGGGMMASLTGGLETRRSAVALATVNALATLFYGILDSHPGLPR